MRSHFESLPRSLIGNYLGSSAYHNTEPPSDDSSTKGLLISTVSLMGPDGWGMAWRMRPTIFSGKVKSSSCRLIGHVPPFSSDRYRVDLDKNDQPPRDYAPTEACSELLRMTRKSPCPPSDGRRHTGQRNTFQLINRGTITPVGFIPLKKACRTLRCSYSPGTSAVLSKIPSNCSLRLLHNFDLYTAFRR